MLFLRTFFYRPAAVLAVASLAACSSSKKDDPTPPPHEMRWTVDGAAVQTASLQSRKDGANLFAIGTLDASSTSSSTVTLYFPAAVGTYVLGPNSLASYASYDVSILGSRTGYITGYNPSAPALVGSGTIVVTAISATEATGTFTFTGITMAATASKAVTNGSFRVGL